MAGLWLASGLTHRALSPDFWQGPQWTLFAQAASPPKPPPTPEVRPLVWLYLVLLAVALVGILVLYFIARWRNRAAQDRLTASDQLSEFRTLYERGEMSREEYERVRSLLGERMRREVDERTAPAPQHRPTPESPPPRTDPLPPDGIRPTDPE
jgi:hypothetical protein